MDSHHLKIISKTVIDLLDKDLNSRFLINKYSNLKEFKNKVTIYFIKVELPPTIEKMDFDSIKERILIPACYALVDKAKSKDFYGCIRTKSQKALPIKSSIYMENKNTCATVKTFYNIDSKTEILHISLGIIKLKNS